MTSTVLQAVNNATRDIRVRSAMLLGALLEGGSLGSGPFPTGDSGTSFGPFQMHIGGALTSSGLTPAQANDPELAVMAMKPIYELAVNRVPSSLWESNPKAAAEQAAFLAERPAGIYHITRGQEAVDRAWKQVQKTLRGGVAAEISNLGQTAKRAADKAIDPILGPLGDALGNFQTEIKKITYTGLFAAAGIGLIVVGLVQLVSPTIKKGAKAALSVASKVK